MRFVAATLLEGKSQMILPPQRTVLLFLATLSLLRKEKQKKTYVDFSRLTENKRRRIRAFERDRKSKLRKDKEKEKKLKRQK